MAEATSLPDGFEVLEPFVELWSIEGAAQRAQRRLESTESDREAFFNAACELAGPALELLDQKPLDQLDDREQRLMNLMLSLAHVSLAVEIQRDQEDFHAEWAQRVQIIRAPSDYRPGAMGSKVP